MWFILYIDSWVEKIWLSLLLDTFIDKAEKLYTSQRITTTTPTPPSQRLVLDTLEQRRTATPQTSGTFDLVSVDYTTQIRDKNGDLMTTPLKKARHLNTEQGTIRTTNETSITNDHQ